METISLNAYAKLNLALEVKEKRSDGYHEMEMLMQSVSLCDRVRLTKKYAEISLNCGSLELPAGPGNIAFRAAETFFSFTGVKGGVMIELEKSIPFQAGMAGGSADAAAVLVGLNALYETNLSLEQLCGIGVTLGADVPFCLTGGTVHVTGIGDRLEPVKPLPRCSFVIVKPEAGISTAAAFRAVDDAPLLEKVRVAEVLDELLCRSIKGIAGKMCNTFEQVTVLPEVFEAKRKLLEAGALGSLMSGSGSAVFGVFDDTDMAKAACTGLSSAYKEVYYAEPVDCGVKII